MMVDDGEGTCVTMGVRGRCMVRIMEDAGAGVVKLWGRGGRREDGDPGEFLW